MTFSPFQNTSREYLAVSRKSKKNARCCGTTQTLSHNHIILNITLTRLVSIFKSFHLLNYSFLTSGTTQTLSHHHIILNITLTRLVSILKSFHLLNYSFLTLTKQGSRNRHLFRPIFGFLRDQFSGK